MVNKKNNYPINYIFISPKFPLRNIKVVVVIKKVSVLGVTSQCHDVCQSV